MTRWLSPGVVFVILLLVAPCRADVYVFTDHFGVRHFTDKCAESRCKLFLKTRIPNQPQGTSSAAHSRIRSTPRNAYAYSPYGRIKLLHSGSQYYVYSPYARSRSISISASDHAYSSITSSSEPSLEENDSAGRRPRAINQANRQFYTPQIELIAKNYGLDPKLMHAVISAESAYNPTAISDKGAMGLMQLMPDTARRFGVPDPFDPVANMHGGARYLRWLMDRFQNNLNLVLAAYNAGEGAVERYGNTIPPYEETRTYVVRVLDYYNYYRGVN
jgi:soluble lytic murein transglycosylase-like protein